jgi:outer membrane autotransporter protein
MELGTDGKIIVKGVRVNPQVKALSEGYLSGLALINQSADLAADKGLGAALASARHGKQAFAMIDGGSARYDTGSHVDVDSFALLAGLAGKLKLDPGMLTLGAFVIHGEGDYDTHNSFGNAASVKGKGDTEYTGLGILARLDFTGTNAGYPYAEASLQGGRVKSDFHSGDIVDTFTGHSAKYRTRSAYQAVHLGAGYVWNIDDKASFDLYGKYLYARRGSDSVTLNTGDPVKFGAAESQRLRIGGRYFWTIDNLKPYVGLAWDHEFDGRAKATTYGYKIDDPDLKGDTGIVEVGLTLTPSRTQPLSIDLGIQGYAGQREGASGSIRVRYEF